MENLQKLEVVVANWYKRAPHLPIGGQRWLAQSIWWLTLIGACLGVMGAAELLTALIFGGWTGFLDVIPSGVTVLNVGLTMLLALVSLVISIMAINPLRAMRKKGWLLLFIVLLIDVLSDVIGFVLTGSVFGLLFDLLFVVVAGYFLYEIRDYFSKAQ